MNRLALSALIFFCLNTVTYGQAPNQRQKLPTKLPRKTVPAQLENVAAGASNEPTSSNSTPFEEASIPKRGSLDAKNTVRINYGNASWNKSSTTIDSASIFMREGKTGRALRILLTETQPDSSVFSGLYSIRFEDLERLQIEFFVPPQVNLDDINELRKLSAKIEAKTLQRSPYILRRTPTGQQKVEIFDTTEQARSALRAYRKEQQLIALQNQKVSKLPSDQDVAAAKLAEELRAKAAAAAAAAERARLDQLEANRLAQLRAQQAAAKEADRKARLAQARALADQGLALFQNGRFKEARDAFDKAVELDPDNKLFYFQFAVTLYKTEDFNRSLVYLDLSESSADSAVNPLERAYYIGLNHFRLKDYDQSLSSFESVAKANDPVLSPSSLFYKGLIHFERRQWDESQSSFQAVLDTSKDPRLDESAEAYIETVLRVKRFEEEASRKWLLSLTVGEMIDSNVILASDSQRDAGQATNVEGLRSLLSGSVRYRPIYEETREFAAQLDLMTMYTLDKSFKSDSTLRSTDPTVATLSLPWTHKGLLFKRGHKLDITPGYESIFMSIETTEQSEILNSLFLNLSNLIVMSDSWFANYNAEFRSDTSKLSSSTGDEDSSAIKVKLLTNHLIFLDAEKTRILTLEGAYTSNQAKGRNAIYDRIDLGVGYVRPIFDDWTTNVKLGLYRLNYGSNPNGRVDTSATASGGVNKKINDTWSWGVTGSYNINSSTLDTNTYKKWSALFTLSGSWGL